MVEPLIFGLNLFQIHVLTLKIKRNGFCLIGLDLSNLTSWIYHTTVTYTMSYTQLAHLFTIHTCYVTMRYMRECFPQPAAICRQDKQDYARQTVSSGGYEVQLFRLGGYEIQRCGGKKEKKCRLCPQFGGFSFSVWSKLIQTYPCLKCQIVGRVGMDSLPFKH